MLESMVIRLLKHRSTWFPALLPPSFAFVRWGNAGTSWLLHSCRHTVQFSVIQEYNNGPISVLTVASQLVLAVEVHVSRVLSYWSAVRRIDHQFVPHSTPLYNLPLSWMVHSASSAWSSYIYPGDYTRIYGCRRHGRDDHPDKVRKASHRS